MLQRDSNTCQGDSELHMSFTLIQQHSIKTSNYRPDHPPPPPPPPRFLATLAIGAFMQRRPALTHTRCFCFQDNGIVVGASAGKGILALEAFTLAATPPPLVMIPE